ncbi:unnamed protein product, partial [Lota lota]
PHSQPGSALPPPAHVPLLLHLLHPHPLRAAGAPGRDVGPHQHRHRHRVRLPLPEGRGAGGGAGEGAEPGGPDHHGGGGGAGGRRGRMGVGEGGGVSPPAVVAALPRAQHRRPAGHPGLRGHTAG